MSPSGSSWKRNYSCRPSAPRSRSEEHTSELQSQSNLVCRLLLEKKNRTPCRRCFTEGNRQFASQCVTGMVLPYAVALSKQPTRRPPGTPVQATATERDLHKRTAP